MSDRERAYLAVWEAYYELADRRDQPGLTYAEACKLADIALDTQELEIDLKIGGTE